MFPKITFGYACFFEVLYLTKIDKRREATCSFYLKIPMANGIAVLFWKRASFPQGSGGGLKNCIVVGLVSSRFKLQ